MSATVQERFPERIWCVDRDGYQPGRLHCSPLDHGADYVCYVRADLLDQLQADKAALVEVLRPFANAADDLAEGHPEYHDIFEAPVALNIQARHLRKARSTVALCKGGAL